MDLHSGEFSGYSCRRKCPGPGECRVTPLGLRYHCAFERTDLGAEDPEETGRTMQLFQKVCHLVAKLGGRSITIHVGGLGRESAFDLCWRKTLAGLTKLVHMATNLGIKLCIANLAWGWTSRPNLFEKLIRLSGAWAFQEKRHLGLILRELQQDLAAQLAACQGWWIEEKPLGLVLHCRLTTPKQEAMIRRSIASWLRKVTREQQFSILDGKKGIELLPLGVSKGAALGKVLAFEETLPFFPVCLGDGHRDESAVQTVQMHSGRGIKVGGDHESSSAIYGFSHLQEVQVFLRLLISAINHRRRL